MKVLAAVLSATLAALAAGCSAGSAHPGAPGGHRPSSPAAAGVTSSPAAIRVTRAHAVPGCTTATAHARSLGKAGTSLESVPGGPFGVAVTSGGRWSFVSLVNSVAVLRTGGQAAPSLIRTIPLPGHGAALGEALTRDGRYLLVADGSGAEVIDVAAAENGSPHPVLGSLTDTGGGAIEVALSAGDQYAFVSLEDSQELAGKAALLGYLPVGGFPRQMALEPGGATLLVTNFDSRQLESVNVADRP